MVYFYVTVFNKGNSTEGNGALVKNSCYLTSGDRGGRVTKLSLVF